MVKYVLAASGLKLFSSSSVAKSAYRTLGNTLGNRKRLRSGMPDYYVRRVARMLNLHQRFQIIGHGDRIVEIGTGWMHWEALTIRLFFDIEAILFDVWDNRQLPALKQYLTDFGRRVGTDLSVPPDQMRRVSKLIEEILRTRSFEELYDLLGFKYMVDKNGNLNRIESESVDFVVSAGVLEHVKRDHVGGLVKEFNRLLKPGGFSMHSINLGDHLQAYDRSVSEKNYLKYSDKIWHRLFENEVQYINRLQRPEWLALFGEAKFKLVNEESIDVSLGKLKVHEKYGAFSREELGCFSLNLLHRKESPS